MQDDFWLRILAGDGAQGLMQYAYYKLWGYGGLGTSPFEIVDPDEGNSVVADECSYSLITSQNLTTGTIPLKDRRGYTTYHAQTITPNRALIPRVVYIPSSYDPTEDVYVGGHRSHLFGSWTHHPRHNDLVFKIYAEETRP
jgi:hypothetical protein